MALPRSVRVRRAVTALLLSTALLAGAAGCGNGGGTRGAQGPREDVSVIAPEDIAVLRASAERVAAEEAAAQAAEPTPSTSAERQKFAKTRFVVNAGLAAGATYQWIIKPYRAGKFKKGADGRTFALIKAGLAGAFAYNRLKAAANNAKADPLLSKAVAPLAAGIESLKSLGGKLRKGDANESDITNFDDVIKGVKEAGKSAGAEVTDQVPSLSQLGG